MTKNPKTIKAILLGGAAVVSFIMAATSAVLLAHDHALPAALFAMTIVVLSLSPFPIASTVVLVRALDRYATEAESYTTRDPLTGLYNQHTFWDLLQYETQRSTRQKYKFSLLLIDVDNFKMINDKFGHEVGDLFLKDFSNILKAAVRKGDIPSRYGGDNFTAILPVCDEEQAYVVAKRLMDGLRGHTLTLPDGSQVSETISVGVAVFPSHAADAQDLFLLADSMLGQAKSAGKDNISFPSDGDNVEMLKNMGETHIMILDALRSRNKRIVPYFQPIMNVKDKTINAYEVLTRIIVDDRIIAAADFIEAAENMGVIGKIDYQLIEQAFIIVKEQNYKGTLFLNLSPKAMVINNFMPTVRALFRDYDINPGDMVFEITERDTIKNIRMFEQFVHTLKDEGFRFAIDDFGAGYSSFQYLKTLPIDYLKVDGEFIRSMGGNGTIEKEIVSSIAALAEKIKVKTIAEFVESEAILGEVASAGIHYAQGYYIQKPSPNLI
ncbi:MAG: putative bifunctional diguanylate cyclase/phosphodiesterase [Nitrospirota bacterium]